MVVENKGNWAKTQKVSIEEHVPVPHTNMASSNPRLSILNPNKQFDYEVCHWVSLCTHTKGLKTNSIYIKK